MFLKAMILQKGVRNTIERVWLLLDNQSTAEIFSNTHLLKDIRHSKGAIHHNSLQHQEATRDEGRKSQGIHHGLVQKAEINNILSFINIREKYPMRYDTKGGSFVVMKTDREILFSQSATGLYFHDMSNRDVVLINTVKEIWEGLPRVNIKGRIRCNGRWMCWGTQTTRTLIIQCVLV